MFFDSIRGRTGGAGEGMAAARIAPLGRWILLREGLALRWGAMQSSKNSVWNGQIDVLPQRRRRLVAHFVAKVIAKITQNIKKFLQRRPVKGYNI